MPKRVNQHPGVFRRGSGWTYVLNYKDAKGITRQVWKGGFATQRLAHEARTEEENKRNHGVSIAPSKLTVKDWLERWLHDYASQLAPATQATYAINLRTHIIPKLGDVLLRDLRPEQVASCYGDIVLSGRSLKTALNVHRVFRGALEHAVNLELVGRNVADAVKAPRPQKKKVNPPVVENIDAMLKEADKTQYGLMCRLALYTGMRQGELIRLEWSHVSLSKGQLLIGDGAKWGSEGTLLLSPMAVSLLKRQQAALKELRMALGPAWPNEPYVFLNAVGRQMDPGGLKRTWRRIQQTTGSKTTFHGLRHAYASLMIAQGVDLKYLQGAMRHKQISTTGDIYGHLMPSRQRELADKIDDALKGMG